MNCRDALRLMNAHVDGELDLASVLALDEHVAACRGCRAEQASMRALSGALREHCDPGGASDALRERLHSRLGRRDASPVRWHRRRFVFAIPAAAAAGLAAVVGVKLLAGGTPGEAPAQRIVYHITQTDTASAALRTLGNHLDAVPGVQVIVVAHNNGINFLLRGARDESGALYEAAVKRFSSRGVQFRVCNNTLVRQAIEAGRVVPEATLVPSGIAEIGRLQSQEGYAYMRL